MPTLGAGGMALAGVVDGIASAKATTLISRQTAKNRREPEINRHPNFDENIYSQIVTGRRDNRKAKDKIEPPSTGGFAQTQRTPRFFRANMLYKWLYIKACVNLCELLK
jgi:hypothetical protein